MRTRRTGGAATLYALLAEADLRGAGRLRDCTDPLEMGLGENMESTQLMFVEVSDVVEKIPIKTHCAYATSAGANKRTVLRRSVSVHPIGGVSRSACVAQTGYPAPGTTDAVRSSSQTAFSP